MRRTINKPPYIVPTMAEIGAAEADPAAHARRPVVISTFAGGGGSSLGWRMAGFRVAWASEFDGSQAAAYRLNMNPATTLDERDVREVGAEEVMRAAGVGPGELDVLDGSPPCQTFSTAGKRQMSDSRSDLFFEYIRLLRAIRPRAFVAENVSGLAKGVAKGMFKIILRELKASGYRVSARMLDAQWLGVPQVRKRVIFVGARDDLGAEPAHPAPLPHRYSVSEACPWITGAKTRAHGFTKENDLSAGKLAPTVTTNGSKSAYHGHNIERDASIEGTCLEAPSERIGPGEQSERYFQLQRAHPDRPSPTIVRASGSRGTAGVIHPTEKRKFIIAELKRVCSFPDDFDMGDLSYAKRWAVMGNAVPPLMMRAVAEAVRDEVLARQRRPARRLSRLLGVAERDLPSMLRLRNLLPEFPGPGGAKGDAFPPAAARAAARRVRQRLRGDVLLLGRGVSAAFGEGGRPFLEWFDLGAARAAVFPHPSGISHWWNDPANVARARAFIRRLVRKVVR